MTTGLTSRGAFFGLFLMACSGQIAELTTCDQANALKNFPVGRLANYSLSVVENANDNRRGNIAYGVDGVFNFKEVSGKYTCNHGAFGDPVPGKVKSCLFALADYDHAGVEGTTFSAGSDQTPVAYGANGKFVFGLFVGSAPAPCTNAAFGSDPAPGVVKSCYTLNRSRVADEGQTYRVSGSANVRYGSGLNGNFIASAQASAPCTNANFGGDPMLVP